MFNIDSRAIGQGHPCFIIAEAGVNHNGDLGLAIRLIDAAAESGADAVKFQTWITEKIVTKEAGLALYQHRAIGEKSQFEMLKQLELTQDQFRTAKAHAESRNVLFLSTPDEEDSADFLETLGLPAFKIGSGEITNLPFLRHVSQKGRPVILSTGMSTLSEVEAAVSAIESTGNTKLLLLHCVSDYPAQPADCNLKAMDTLRQAFGYPVGFSDHTMGREVAIGAVALGACVLEKHLTLDTQMEGPDHRASLDPKDFGELVRAVRNVESAIGNGIKRPNASELQTKTVVQKSLVAAREIPAGEKLSEDHIMLRRTSGGLPASLLPILMGRRARNLVPPLATLKMEMFD